MYPQHFIIEGKYLGTGMRRSELTPSGARVPHSMAFFCRGCGEVWAKLPVEMLPGKPSAWIVHNVDCRKEKHQIGLGRPPGSLYNLYWETDMLSVLPDAVVKWEFDRHMEALENA